VLWRQAGEITLSSPLIPWAANEKRKKRFFFSVLTLRDDEREEKTYV
jgi:hypothetical protein